MKKYIFLIALLCNYLFAHAIWTEIIADRLSIIYGDGPYNNKFKPEALFYSAGYDKDFKEIPIEVNKDYITTITNNENLVVLALKSNKGYWTQGADGKWKNVSLEENPGAKKALYVEKYNVTYIDWQNRKNTNVLKTTKPLPNIPFQIVPLENPLNKKVGEALKVQVLKDGKPVANIDVKYDFNHNGDLVAKTDKKGIATIKIPHDGTNVFAAYLSDKYTQDDKKAYNNSIWTTFSFALYNQDSD